MNAPRRNAQRLRPLDVTSDWRFNWWTTFSTSQATGLRSGRSFCRCERGQDESPAARRDRAKPRAQARSRSLTSARATPIRPTRATLSHSSCAPFTTAVRWMKASHSRDCTAPRPWSVSRRYPNRSQEMLSPQSPARSSTEESEHPAMIVSLKPNADTEAVRRELTARGLWVGSAASSSDGADVHFIIAKHSGKHRPA